MKRILKTFLVAVLTILIVSQSSLEIRATESMSDKVASGSERASQSNVEEEGMTPISGKDVNDGTYDVKVESSSAMFNITKATLNVKEGKMTSVITLSGKGYLKLFMGKGEEAVKKDETAFSKYLEDETGAYTYEIPVESLDKGLQCTGFSKRKEKWYDHEILFRADSLPHGAIKTSASKAHKKLPIEKVKLDDGAYTIKVQLKGGSGRASIDSPAKVTVKDKEATAIIKWSSANYDYMIVNGKKYKTINKKGNSQFEIPIVAFNEEMTVIGDTTAMSKPHEIEYTLKFDLNSAQVVEERSSYTKGLLTIGALCFVAVLVGSVMVIISKMRKKKDE
ncbi:hypothetical protein SAMN04487761_11333 [Lachnospiraceae bacterium C7]|nr:hypothetical protein SAMN04487761_11333 [Lachnospiraceae bacterium C7]